MIMESVQMLSTVCLSHGKPAPYKATHKNHPCTVWAGECSANYRWLWHLCMELGEQWIIRRGKIHKSTEAFVTLPDPYEAESFLRNDKQVTPFAQCMPDEYKVDGNPVAAYRAYYRGEKADFAKWDWIGNTPDWWAA
jgi:hypothetical protein